MQMIRTVFLVVTIFVLTLAMAAFALYNSDLVELEFFDWHRKYPLFLLLFLAFAGGVLLSGVLSLFEIVRLQSRVRKSHRMQEMLEREVDALRNQPLYEEPHEGGRSSKSKSAEPSDLPPDLIKRENIG